MYKLLCKLYQMLESIVDIVFRKKSDFSTWVIPKEIAENEEKGNKYQPSTDSLKKVLKKLKITQEDSIIDIGCGKGKALYIMSKFPFKKICGYDLSKELVDLAKTNMKKLGLNEVEIFVADASNFNKYDDYNYFYIYNSVPEKVFIKMMKNIKKSIEKKPRNCTFIYLNPVYDNIVKNNDFKEFYNYKSIIKWFNYKCYKIEVGETNEKN